MARPRKTAGASAPAPVESEVITLTLNEWNTKGRNAVFAEHGLESAHVVIDLDEGTVSIVSAE